MYTVTDERGNIRLISDDQLFDKLNDPNVAEKEKERFLEALTTTKMLFQANKLDVVVCK